ncbi:hypothetical protein D3C85_1840290 [compost metagenome]
MTAKLLKLVTPDGVEVEYVRTIRKVRHQIIGCSMLLSRYSPEQQKAIRAGRPF